MAFERDFMHANGSGKDNKSTGGNDWTYRPENGDSLATIRAVNYFNSFFDSSISIFELKSRFIDAIF